MNGGRRLRHDRNDTTGAQTNGMLRAGRVTGEMTGPPEADPYVVPPGWDYNPSGWGQRLPVVGLAVLGFGIATYLALSQWGVLGDVWEPFFGEGSRVVLSSSISRLLPIPDAALGALGYLVDAVTGVVGGRARWRTMPWLVVVFGLAVGPLGAVSVLLVILQPVVLDAWCTLCLVSAAVSLLMIGPALDEVLAALQTLRRAREDRRSLWRAFWGLEDHHLPEAASGAARSSARPSGAD